MSGNKERRFESKAIKKDVGRGEVMSVAKKMVGEESVDDSLRSCIKVLGGISGRLKVDGLAHNRVQSAITRLNDARGYLSK